MPKVESNAAIEALEKKKMNAAHWCVASLAIGLVGERGASGTVDAAD